MTNYNTIYRDGKRLILDDNGLNYLLHLEHEHNKLEKEYDTYKKRIEKAINYINGAYEMAVYTKNISLDKENIEDLLDILGGDINDR